VEVRRALWMPEPRVPLRIDLNTADEWELATLPGVDAERARAIVERRRQLGAFASLEALRELGVGL
jgi:DNA uptake protein ComE-like DNA-binding protein